MSNLISLTKKLFHQPWQGTLSDYVTAITWSPDNQTLAAVSGAGEVALWVEGNLTLLQTADGQSVDCLAFSKDGKFLAAGGQNGQVKIWRFGSGESQLITTLENAPNWVDKLAWNPTCNELAFSMGRYVQVWDAEVGEVVVTLNFETSSVLSMAWHPSGQQLAIAGHQGIKVWDTKYWDEDPEILVVSATSLAIAWSLDGKFIASGNLDNTITVWQWNNPQPWLMRGFPGKIRAVTWSEAVTGIGYPLLAVATALSVIIWEKDADESAGWQGRALDIHDGIVQAISFQPGNFLLASAAEDGVVCLWQKAKQLVQTLPGAAKGFSCLAWHPQGNKLAAGGTNGELLVWSKVTRTQGFGKAIIS
ncbi:WD40 repeat domain-containing protein [Argonema antarcticum]|uniref:WD40 repeat domain-containing protein n=1 Tax=Argonema antarcticum TaxID=2942763 RepID=UPI0020120912|nr:WD40 repeat domain-containing protein [Argonema antarcticum]MCL1469087.1 WD40 repeat domain-containing protein [Argonema antarcticum A004/B2]